ncbi:glutamate-5-semialdehyde dehydrogenase [Sphingobacterium sp. DK4209]|uniref:Gamma-glutamyl phosphate reductase n=1 Tax=Sphingobacterium zhuxiongii TaxID=2662364 RepID=A0A5Q0QD91_9SPHI|nr:MULTISPECIES: glutamate-5-semialdehyde dehydrogenase [unclassified Sphingobacterium]MVZ66375.1 glutamate-5-semialdehyde dehydrogenase [Sphingobacterium sp. DK4209]QGA25150.1 glutamate-5-semialdehyde dehydrogenase [Sphingobacterium sp. dk4302]
MEEMKGTIQPQLIAARKAKQVMLKLSLEQKKEVLTGIARSLVEHSQEIMVENKRDLDRMDPADSKYDRLLLDNSRIENLAKSVLDVANLADPTGQTLSTRTMSNGLYVVKKTVPLGVVGVIYESRPNVTVDVACLCIQSGNVCLLRGGSDAWYTNSYLISLIQEVLRKQNLDTSIVQLLPTDRELVTELLEATAFVDIIIPRGSQSLIDFVRENAKVPVIETGAGVCHTFVDASANIDMAAKIVANAKISRPSVCNSLDTVLLEKTIVESFLSTLAPLFLEHEVQVFADERSYNVLSALGYPHLKMAQESDFGREFLDLICSIKVLDGLDDALTHIANYSSKHSECIVSENQQNITTFMELVDAAAVYANASTRFTDGGEFGLGAEIGISTQKLHARGPFALEKLVTEKWFVIGQGQIR